MSVELETSVPPRSAHPNRGATLIGLLAVVMWGTTIAMLRQTGEALGTLRSAAWAHVIGGGLGCVLILLRTRRIDAIVPRSRRYLVIGGAIFLIYSIVLYLAIQTAASRAQAVQVGLVNYLWPSLTLVFSIPLLGYRATWKLLLPGIAIGLAGVSLGALSGQPELKSALAAPLRDPVWPYVLALGAGVGWALFSTLTRRWSAGAEESAVPLFLVVSGVVLLGLCPFVPGPDPKWSSWTMFEVLYMALVPTLAACLCWDYGMRRGDVVLLGSVSLCIPLVSSLISSFYLRVQMGVLFWIACLLVFVGAVVCQRSVRDAASGGEALKRV